MEFKAVPDVLMYFLYKFGAFFLFVVGKGNGDQALDDGTDEIKQIDIVHGEYGGAGLLGVRIGG